jgi:hypothetical protein
MDSLWPVRWSSRRWMSHRESNCAICGKRVTWQFGLCEACQQEYGRRAKDQPEWVRFMRADKERERRFWIKVRQHEVPLSTLEKD